MSEQLSSTNVASYLSLMHWHLYECGFSVFDQRFSPFSSFAKKVEKAAKAARVKKQEKEEKMDNQKSQMTFFVMQSHALH